MTKYLIAYKEKDKWIVFATATSTKQVAQKVADLYEFKGAVEKIQIQKVIR